MSTTQELREWIQLAFVVVGGVIALAAFFQNLRQRRVENALKFVALFRDGLHQDDIKYWNELFRSSSELAGAKPGYYRQEWEAYRPIADYFSEGATDGHAIARMAVALDIVCHQVVSHAADAKTVYYELGQLLSSMHFWLQNSKSSASSKSLLEVSFPSIDTFFRRFKPEKASWPSRIYAFIE